MSDSNPTKDTIPEFWGRAYTAPEITVYYNRERCIHFAACVRGLPQVFDTAQKPWIQPSNPKPPALTCVKTAPTLCAVT